MTRMNPAPRCGQNAFRKPFSSTGALVCLLLALPAGQTIASDDLAEARIAFARAISDAHGVPTGAISVRPLYPGLPDNPYDELNTPPFFALGASWPDTAPGPQGFAAADGRTIILRDLDGIAAFLAAARKMSATPRALNIVRRIMWLYQADPANRLIENHPRLAAVRPPQIAWSPDGGLDATWFVERGGQTGWIGVFRADFHFMPGEKPHYSEIFLP